MSTGAGASSPRDPAVIEQAVIEIVREAVEAKPGQIITAATSFLGELETDSLSLVRIDTLLQAKLGLALSADDIEDIETVGDLIEALTLRGQPVEAD